ncbi:MAG TPA: hypothetical protein VFB82_09100, partial [Blastocatellia bacterium]|nr:hypothetical protein [Blastocatellia bacterium]
DARNHFGYLRSIQVLAKERVEDGHFEYDENDLINETLWEIAKVLPTKRGQMAEQAWVGFCRSRLEDARRRIQGRKGNKERWKRAEMKLDKESGRLLDPLEEIPAPSQELDLLASEAKQEKLRTIIRETIANIQDPLTRRVAEDQFLGDPSPVSGQSVAGSKRPLTEQCGVSRDRINRAIRRGRGRIAARLLQLRDPDFDFDRKVLLKWMRGTPRRT